VRSASTACVCLLLTAALAPHVLAAEPVATPRHPIDRQLAACVERDYSTAGMTNCAYEAQEAWDQELNTRYAQLLASLPAAEADALRAAQRQWLAFRDAEYDLIDAVFGQLEGTMWIPVRVSHRSSLTEKRARDLAYYQAILDETWLDDESPSTPLEDATPTLDPLDRAFADCFWGDTTTSAQVECAHRAGEAWDGRLNANYARLRDDLPPAGQDALRLAQRRWLAFRDAEFTALDAIYRTRQGSMYYPLRMKARYELVQGRAMELGGYHRMDDPGE
jgi:uncharacterized protein YecT (DUF1311 family)